MISPPTKREIYASNETSAANHPFNRFLPSHISPEAKSNKNIPAKEIHIFNIDNDMFSPLIRPN